MNQELLNIAVDPIINSLLKLKRGELGREEALEMLERVKDASDVLIRSIEFDVSGDIYGC